MSKKWSFRFNPRCMGFFALTLAVAGLWACMPSHVNRLAADSSTPAPLPLSVVEKISRCMDWQAFPQTEMIALRTQRRAADSPTTCSSCNNATCGFCHNQGEAGVLITNDEHDDRMLEFYQKPEGLSLFIQVAQGKVSVVDRLQTKSLNTERGPPWSHPWYTLDEAQRMAFAGFSKRLVEAYESTDCLSGP